MNKCHYPEFEALLAKRGVAKTKVARAIGVSSRALYNKLTGRSPLGWAEACIIQEQFFPDVGKDELFKTQ